ncbi:MAG: enoyl-CoA hydratase/isomerase family protein [Ktedonobacteraceae bacterium]
MQQSYRALRIIAEAQTIRVVLAPEPDESMLKELCVLCDSLHTESSSGIKAVVLDFNPTAAQLVTHNAQASAADAATMVSIACEATYAINQPVLAVVRDTLSQSASLLVKTADLTLVAENAGLKLSDEEEDILTGVQALRLGYITWTASVHDINKQMERVLDLLRTNSAIALRQAKASVRLAHANHATKLEALEQVNRLYLEQLMQTHDAQEGLQAFLEKRKPIWKNK